MTGGVATKPREWYHESLKDIGAPEIITAAPDVSSVTLVVTSDDKRNEETVDEETMLMGTTVFGRKTGATDHTEGMTNATTSSVTGAPIARDGNVIEAETTRGAESWSIDGAESSTEQQTTIDFVKTQKKNTDPSPARKVRLEDRVGGWVKYNQGLPRKSFQDACTCIAVGSVETLIEGDIHSGGNIPRFDDSYRGGSG